MIEQELIEVYHRTQYRVFNTQIILQIGEHSSMLDTLLNQYHQQDWAFITACNPGSDPLPDEVNRLRHEQLKEALGLYSYFEGEGVGENPPWKPEQSLLIVGISRSKAIEIGNLFEQNAIVAGRIYLPAELLILR
ncbi:MAG: DUF3293 domain-containing protein [Bacteroidota bacterium]|nr:DUF3293 domain-containing protein [Bacteroidota bacterium]MDP4248828.1 DUF3293 domain-containing protein [Bacteroidota bacterium]